MRSLLITGSGSSGLSKPKVRVVGSRRTGTLARLFCSIPTGKSARPTLKMNADEPH